MFLLVEQLVEVSEVDGSGETDVDCGDTCQLYNEPLIGDDFVWQETNFSDCSVTCGTGETCCTLVYLRRHRCNADKLKLCKRIIC